LVHDHNWTIVPPPEGQPGKATVIKPDGTIYDPMPEWRKRRRQPQDDLARKRLDTLKRDTPPPHQQRDAG
jgi:hypothetical protein